MPCLQQLLGQSLQLHGISCSVNCPGKAFNFKLLTNCELLRARHHGTNEQHANTIGKVLILCALNYAREVCEQINGKMKWMDQIDSFVRSGFYMVIFLIQ